jgi:hypothetical protein
MVYYANGLLNVIFLEKWFGLPLVQVIRSMGYPLAGQMKLQEQKYH